MATAEPEGGTGRQILTRVGACTRRGNVVGRKGEPAATDFEGRAALVTGGARGLGAEVVRALCAAGASVAFSYLSSAAAAKTLAKELSAPGAPVIAKRADVSLDAQAKDLVRSTERRFGKVDLLVNNASYSRPALWNAGLDEIAPKEMARAFEVDVVGAFNASRAAATGMRKRGYGRIVNFASAGAMAGDHTLLAYNPAKMGVVGLTRSLATLLAPDGITVNAVAPGSIDTGWLKSWSLTQSELQETLREIPAGRVGKPREAVDAVLFLLSDHASFITGQTLRVDGGVNLG